MRIAYLTQSYPPMISGAAISAQQTAEAMAQRGHQVLVIAASDKVYPYHTYRENLTILRLRSFNNPLRVGQRLILHPRSATLQALQQFQPDLIHVHEPVQMGMLALEYARGTHIPVTLTAHQLPWFVASYLPKSFQPIVENGLWKFITQALHQYTSIIAPTQTVANIIKEKTRLEPKVISNGLNLKTFRPSLSLDDETAARQKWNLLPGNPLLLHVGRLDADKQVDKVIRVVAQTIRETDAHLVIVGDGCQKNDLIKLSTELGVRGRVHFLGFVSVEAGLPEIYRLANIFVSTSEIETQGLVLLEAAASALPIVAVNATCISEIVHDQVNGILVRPGDLEAFQTATVELVKNPKRARQMGMASRILAEEHDLQKTWKLQEELYWATIKQARIDLPRKRRLASQWKVVKTLIGIK